LIDLYRRGSKSYKTESKTIHSALVCSHEDDVAESIISNPAQQLNLGLCDRSAIGKRRVRSIDLEGPLVVATIKVIKFGAVRSARHNTQSQLSRHATKSSNLAFRVSRDCEIWMELVAHQMSHLEKQTDTEHCSYERTLKLAASGELRVHAHWDKGDCSDAFSGWDAFRMA
jgi:hypothetical protein